MSNLACQKHLSVINWANLQIQEVTPDVDRVHFWFPDFPCNEGFSLGFNHFTLLLPHKPNTYTSNLTGTR